MNKVVEKILEHPVASFFLIDVTFCGIAKVIHAIKGPKVETVVKYVVDNVESIEEKKEN